MSDTTYEVHVQGADGSTTLVDAHYTRDEAVAQVRAIATLGIRAHLTEH